MNYPSEKRMFMGTDIGEGWHNFKKETEKNEISKFITHIGNF